MNISMKGDFMNNNKKIKKNSRDKKRTENKPEQNKTKKMFLLLLLILLIKLTLNLTEYVQHKQELVSVENILIGKKLETRKLKNLINKLETDNKYIEEIAKDYYQMIKEEEIIYIQTK